MKKIQVLPNVITAFGLSCGLFVIFKMATIPLAEVNSQALTGVAAILLLAGLADLLDGLVARVMKAESDFGGYFDSLSDAITFGVAPSVIVIKSFMADSGSTTSFLLTTSAMVFSVCGVLRLVRFNVIAQHSKEDVELAIANKKNFTGLPIPAAAAAAVSANLFFLSEEFKEVFDISLQTRAWLLFFVMIILGYFMICRWKFPSLKTLQVRVASFQVVFLTVLTTVILFYGIINHFSVVFFLITWLYIALAWTLSIIRLLKGKKSKTLEDFEPDHDDFS